MPEEKITREQLKRLQTLWSQYARHELMPALRGERLSWASHILKRQITSFSELTISEASTLINMLQDAMGIAETRPNARPRHLRSRIQDRDRAHAAGTEGRRGGSKKITIASAEDLAMIDAQLTAMGWTRVRLDAFLESPSSPLRGKKKITTLGQVNSVMWALKRIAKSAPRQEVASGE